MSFPRYEAYKDSGIESLGDVPEHWTVCAIKHFCITITDGAHVSPETENGVFCFVSTQDLKGREIDFDSCLRTSEQSYEYLVRTGCKPEDGDVLFSKDGTVGRTVVVRTQQDFVVASSLIILRPNRKILSPEYLHFLCQSASVINQVESFVKGAGLPRLSISNLLRVVGVFPPNSEQIAIAAFLERETSKIDALVDEQQRLIELLKEKRQAAISHAVTKGLDPNVPMKDSGIEWLGTVPAHWSHPKKLTELACRSRHSFTNGPFGSDLLTSELIHEGVPVIYIRDLKPDGYRRVSEWCVTEEKAHSLKACGVRTGDILIAKVGDPPGLAVVYPDGEPEAIVTQDVIRLRTDDNIVDQHYLAYILNSYVGRVLIDSIAVESTRMRVGLGDYKQLACIIPPLPEQREIVSFLNSTTSVLDQLTSEAKAGIFLLQERRSALISAAVTGKIDVRRLVPVEAEAA